MHPMKNSASGSWVEASLEATLCEGVCTAASRSSGGMGREHVVQITSCAESGTVAREDFAGDRTLERTPRAEVG